MVEWKERYHTFNEMRAMTHQPTLDALRNFGFLKLYMIPIMWNQAFLLSEIIWWWDVDS